MGCSPKRELGLVISWVDHMETSLSVEDRMEGASNFSPWKERIVLLLEEHELWDIVEKTATVPTDATLWPHSTKGMLKPK